MIALVVLAAGASRRLGRCKATVALGDRSALEHILHNTAAAGIGPALVITGADDVAIREHLAQRTVEVSFHPHWEEGRTSGAARAARLRSGRDLCIATLDAPLVPDRVYRALAQSWQERGRPARGWLAPAHRRDGLVRYGHPLFLGRDLAEELSHLDPAESLRSLRAVADPLWGVEVDSASVLDHLDTPEDLATIRERIRPG